MMDALEVSTDSQNSSTSLRVSLELSISQIKNTNPEALNFFGFIGQFPGGIGEIEITQMWGDNSWVPLKDALIRASLLVYKRENNGKFVYNMLPFMTIRASELLDEDHNEKLRHEFHQKSCRLYKDYCVEIYNSEKTMDTVEKLTEYETNIWACIYRSLNRRRDIKYISSQAESSKSIPSEVGETTPKGEEDEWAIDSVENPLKSKHLPTRGMIPNSEFESKISSLSKLENKI